MHQSTNFHLRHTSTAQHNGIETGGSACEAPLQWLPCLRTSSATVPAMSHAINGDRSTSSRSDHLAVLRRSQSPFSTYKTHTRRQSRSTATDTISNPEIAASRPRSTTESIPQTSPMHTLQLPLLRTSRLRQLPTDPPQSSTPQRHSPQSHHLRRRRHPSRLRQHEMAQRSPRQQQEDPTAKGYRKRSSG